MSDQSTPYYYQNPNNKERSSYLQGWSLSDYWMVAISLLAVSAGWLAVHLDRLHWGWAMLIMFVGFVSNVHIEYARLYKEIYQLFVGGFIALVLRDVLWETDTTSGRIRSFVRDRRYRLSDDRRARIPLSLDFVQASVEEGVVRYGILNELDTDSGYMYVQADGSAYGDLDFEDQQRVHAEISGAINAFFGTADRRVGVTELRVERPADLTSIDSMLAASADPFMFYVDGLPEDIDPQRRHFDLGDSRRAWAEFRSRNSDLLKPVMRRNNATRNWQLLVISFKWKSVASKVLGGKMDDEQINDQPLIELGRTLNQELAMIAGLELQNPRVLGPIELSEFIRCSLGVDLESTVDFYSKKASGEIVTSEDQLEVVTHDMVRDFPKDYSKTDVGTILTDLGTWPKKRIVVKGDRILIDDTWFQSVRFTMTPEVEHPTRAQNVHFAVPPGEWSSHAEVSERTTGSIDTNMLMTQETVKRSFEQYRSRGKIVSNPRFKRRQRMADINLEQVSYASTNQRYFPITVLTAPYDKPKLLKKRFKAYEVKMKSQGIKIVKIRGRVRMLDAVITGVLGVNRL